MKEERQKIRKMMDFGIFSQNQGICINAIASALMQAVRRSFCIDAKRAASMQMRQNV
ncbi:hypothetical protein PIB30_114868, partial [Stylosanthes scabra]|nr:hypothetical protein [Stylosanthes scabra]